MHAIIQASALRDAVAKVAIAIGPRNRIPILDDVLLTAENGALRIYATDLDMAITATIQADIREPGQVTIPAKTLTGFLKNAPKDCLVEIHGETIRAGASSTTFHGHLPADMPIMTIQQPIVELTHLDMLAELAKVRHAISTEQPRYYLNGVYFHAHAAGKNLRMVATDGHRLALTEIPAPSSQSMKMPDVIIPARAVATLCKLLKSKQPIPVKYEIDKCQRMRFSFGNIEIVSKAIDGTFPNYERVIPTQNPQHAIFDRVKLRDAAKAFAGLANRNGLTAMKLSLDGHGQAELTISSPENGTAQRHIPARGDAIDVGFKPMHLVQTLDAMSCDEVSFSFDGVIDPVVIRDPHCASATHVLMPHRV